MTKGCSLCERIAGNPDFVDEGTPRALIASFCGTCLHVLANLVESSKRHSDGPSLADRLKEIAEKPDPENG